MAKNDPSHPPAEKPAPDVEQVASPAGTGVIPYDLVPADGEQEPATDVPAPAEQESPPVARKPWERPPAPEPPEPPADVPGWYRNTGGTTLVSHPHGAPSVELEPGQAGWFPRDPGHLFLVACVAPEAADIVKES